MKQLDVDVSPPALVWNPYLTFTNVTFDLDTFFCHHMSNSLGDMNYCPVNFGLAMHKSPPRISTGGLKKVCFLLPKSCLSQILEDKHILKCTCT